MSVLLFIGGPRDGQWHDVPVGQDRVDVPLLRSLGDRFPADTGEERLRLGMVTYRRLTRPTFSIMVAEGLGWNEVMDRLVAGYRPGHAVASTWEGRGDAILVGVKWKDLEPAMARGCDNTCTVVFRLDPNCAPLPTK